MDKLRKVETAAAPFAKTQTEGVADKYVTALTKLKNEMAGADYKPMTNN